MKDPRYEWDDDKEALNRAKHGIDFDEASTAFDDPLGRESADPDHSGTEDRWIFVGHSRGARLVVVAFTERDGRIRIISARPVTRTERQDHEERPEG